MANPDRSARLKVVVIIPALNEAESLPLVLRDLPHDLVDEVIVVDNGSTDETAQHARALGATVCFEAKRGYGYACLTGIAHARAKKPDVIVFLDGDYSDYPEELPHLLQPIQENRADLVIGSRMTGTRVKGALLPQAILGNWLASTLMRWFWKAPFTDLGPFRAIRFSTFEALRMQDGTYGWTIEMQIKAVRQGFRCTEIPVSYRPRIGTSKVTGTISGTMKASYKILFTIFRYRWL